MKKSVFKTITGCAALPLRKFLACLLVFAMAAGCSSECVAAEETHTNNDNYRIGSWDCIYFGNYYQNDTNGDGKVNLLDEKEPIRWRILSKFGDVAFLFSDKILDAGKINSSNEACTWETCDMRKWLNQTFYQTAFNKKEQDAIQEHTSLNVAATDIMGADGGNPTKDRVFLLSYDEAVNPANGFHQRRAESDTRATTNTAYAATKPLMYSNTNSADAWWLRGPGSDNKCGLYVYPDGGIEFPISVDATAGIRPAIYLDMSDESLWSEAGMAIAEALPTGGDINEEGSGEDIPVIPDVTEPPTQKPESTQKPDVSEKPAISEAPPAVWNRMKYTTKASGGMISSNLSANEYKGNWANTVKSYLAETENGYVRVEAVGDSVVAEQYSRSYQLVSQQILKMELPIFGGCFQGVNYNFLAFGQKNPHESDEVEVIRIVKYDKNWNRLSAVPIYGANTYIPFEAGCLRMTERGENLYIHTCHQMYVSSDGLNHQANMTFVLDQEKMEISQTQYDIKNTHWGYVGHSFNQFVKTDGKYLYRLDHGDAYPRAVVVTKAELESAERCEAKEILPISGAVGDNVTGVEIGGFELAGGQLVTVGNLVPQERAYSPSGQRNIFVISTDAELDSSRTVWLTDYKQGDGIEVGNPHLAKVSENELYVLWEEKDIGGSVVFKMAYINAQGEQNGKTYTLLARLSDCAPVCSSEGEIVWYTTQNGEPVFYHISPKKLDKYGVTERVKLRDCQIILEKEQVEYAGLQSYEPQVTVCCGDYVLKEGEDYVITYNNNNGVGTASLEVTGIGIFQGAVEKSFEIVEQPEPAVDQPKPSAFPALPSDSGGSGSESGSSNVKSGTKSKNPAEFYSKTRQTTYSGWGSSRKKPGRVRISYVYSLRKKLLVSWGYVASASRYQVQCAQNKSFTKKKKNKTVGKNKTSVTFKGLKKGKRYYVRVRAYNASSGYGAWSKVQKCKIRK